MGEIADSMLEGELCQQCGVYLDDDPPGYPRTCDACQHEDEAERPKAKKQKQSKGARK